MTISVYIIILYNNYHVYLMSPFTSSFFNYMANSKRELIILLKLFFVRPKADDDLFIGLYFCVSIYNT